LAVAGFVAALALAAPVVAAVTAAVAVVVPLALSTALRVEDGPWSVGTSALPRVLLALAVVLAARSPVAALLCGVLVVEALLEPVHARVWAATPPFAANLPGLSIPDRGRLHPRIVTAVGAAVAVLVALGAAWHGPVGLLVVPAVGALAVVVAAIARGARRLAARRHAERDLHGLLVAYAPAFAVHWDAPAGTAYQLEMWLPYLQRIGARFVLIVRNPASFAEAVALTDAPVLVRQEHGELDAVVVPSLRAVFYMNNAARNTHFVRFTGLQHVQLGHGESDKAASFSPVFRLYDHDFVAGQAAIDRFAAHGVAMPPSLFRIVGRPQVERVLVGTSTSEMPTALYAPTWGGSYADSDYCSLPIGHTIVEALLRRGFRIVFRPHPYTSRPPGHARAAARIEATLAEHARTSGVPHVFGAEAAALDLYDAFNAAHLMVSDVSSVVADFLHSEKPFAIVAMHGTVAGFAREFPIARAAYVIDRRAGDLERMLDSMTDGDPVAAARRATKTYFLGDIPDDRYAEAFLDAAREVVGLG
ncbi:MAG: CDP-glycerol glycerophosphotransferase family protein, partial [Amnibacterium sp.]